MSLTKVTRNFQITIPAEIRKMFRIDVGSVVDFFVEKGLIVLKPKVLVDEDQAWFWKKEWQKEEKKVDKAKRKGQIKSVKNVKELEGSSWRSDFQDHFGMLP